jgi:cobalt-zinc-cadmium efflux system outer membrane protein
MGNLAWVLTWLITGWAGVAMADAPPAESLDSLEKQLFSQHPAVQAAARAQAVGEAAVEAAGAPMAPELVAQTWATPLRRPWDLGRSQMLMLGARVKLPQRKARTAQRDAERAAARAQLEDAGDLRLSLRADLRQEYAALDTAERARALLEAQLALQLRLQPVVDAGYAAGTLPQRALRDLIVRTARLEAERTRLLGEAGVARMRLNALLGRAPDAPLLVTPLSLPVRPRVQDLERPDTPRQRAAQLRTQSAEARARAAQALASRPEVSVGLDYMAMASDRMYGYYGAMLGLSLPWLSPRARAEEKLAAQGAVLAEAEAQRDAHAERLEAHTAAARFTAAERTLSSLRTQLLPALERAREGEERDYARGEADALALIEASAGLLETQLEALRTEEALHAAAIALERLKAIDLHPATTAPAETP